MKQQQQPRPLQFRLYYYWAVKADFVAPYNSKSGRHWYRQIIVQFDILLSQNNRRDSIAL
jgi:hypothetical protein